MNPDEHMVCLGKKRMTLKEAVAHAKRKKLRAYRCPIDRAEPHFHVTSKNDKKDSRPDRRGNTKEREVRSEAESGEL